MRRDPRRNLTRIETTTQAGSLFRGWVVRLQRRGIQYQRFFNDRRNGGKRGALRAAQQFRDEIESQTREHRVAELAKRPGRRNRSGVVGILRRPPRGVVAETEQRSPVWIAQWVNGHGKRKSRAFSVAVYGEKAARQLARRARTQGVRRSGR